MSALLISLYLVLFCTCAVFADDSVSVLSIQNFGHNNILQGTKSARFGHFPFGDTVGPLVLAPDDKGKSCKSYNLAGAQAGSIIIAHRGDCTFTTKAILAQEANAAGLIVVNNANQSPVIMGDDGSGYLVKIPSILIDHDQGQRLVDAIDAKDANAVRLSIEHYMRRQDRPSYEVWFSSQDPNILHLRDTFSKVALALAKDVDFMPRFIFLDSAKVGCTGTKEGRQRQNCQKFCTNAGRYCGVSLTQFWRPGKEVVEENVRQLCLRQELMEEKRTADWWKYANRFQSLCVQARGGLSLHLEDCAYQAMKDAGLGKFVKSVQQCYKNAQLEADHDVPLIEAELREMKKDGVTDLRTTIVINDEVYYGSRDCVEPIDVTTCPLFAAICSGFTPGKSPAVCNPTSGCPLGKVRDACDECHTVGSKHAHTDSKSCPHPANQTGLIIGLTFVGLLALGGMTAGFLYFYRKHRRISNDVRNIMTQYRPLESEEIERLSSSI